MADRDKELPGLIHELEATRLEMERAYTDHSRLNYDWLARCISVVSRAEQALKRHEIEVIDETK